MHFARLPRARAGLSALLALGLAVGLSGGEAAAQVPNDGKVEIRNSSGEDRRICFYRGHRVINLLPAGCLTLAPGRTVVYDRGTAMGDKGLFEVRVFRPALFDTYLYSRDMPADTGRIVLGEGERFGFARYDSIKPPVSARPTNLELCNTTQREPVWAVVGFRHGGTTTANGWWEVRPGACVSLPFHRYSTAGTGDRPQIYYWARTYGETPTYWSGKDGDPLLCREDGAFRNQWQPRGDPAADEAGEPCDGGGSEIVVARRYVPSNATARTVRLNF